MDGEPFSFEERLRYLQKYGLHCMSFSTLQPNLSYFDVPRKGYLAYKQYAGTRIVLSDPIAAPEHFISILEEALRAHPDTCFVQVHEPIARILNRKFGFYVNAFGVEHFIPRDLFTKKKSGNIPKKSHDLIETLNDQLLKEYLRGNRMEFVRRQLTAALKGGIKIVEQRPDHWDIERLRKLSVEWLQTKRVAGVETVFLTRPFTLHIDQKLGVRLFVASVPNGDILGFSALDPIFRDEQVIGFFCDLVRVGSDAPRGTATALKIFPMSKIFQEGYHLFHLGLSPFSKVGPVFYNGDTGRLEIYTAQHKNLPVKRVDRKFVTSLFRIIFKRGDFLYGARDLAFHKEHFRFQEEPVFYCSKSKIPLAEIVKGFLLSGINPIRQLAISLWRRE